MKKFLFAAVLAVVAVSFTSCKKSPVDQFKANIESIEAKVKDIKSAEDVEKIKSELETVLMSVKDLTPEELKTLDSWTEGEKIMKNIQEGVAAKCKELNISLPGMSVEDAAEDAVEAAEDAAENAVDAAKDAAEGAVDAAKDAAAEAVDAAKAAAEGAVDAAKNAAKDAAADAVKGALDKVLK